jgi:hypothetical protein
MPMTCTEQTAWNAYGSAAGTLNDKVAAYNVAKTAADAAAATLAAATSALDAALVDVKSKEVTFTGLLYTLPVGYNPPSP